MNDNSAIVPRIELEIRRGQARQKRRSVNVPAFLIGSSRDCDLVLGDPGFPEVHAYLIVHRGGVAIRHLGFGPGLFVNERELAQAALQDGDRLQTGPYEFVIHITDRALRDRPPYAVRRLRTNGGTSLAREPSAEELLAVQALLAEIRTAIRCPPRAPRQRAYDRSA